MNNIYLLIHKNFIFIQKFLHFTNLKLFTPSSDVMKDKGSNTAAIQIASNFIAKRIQWKVKIKYNLTWNLKIVKVEKGSNYPIKSHDENIWLVTKYDCL